VDHPDKPANVSVSRTGEVQNVPERVTAVVVTDKEDDPAGVLEKWSADAWIYAETDSLIDLN